MNQPDNMTLLGTLAKSRSENRLAFDWPGTIGRGLLLLVVVLSPWAFGSVYSWAQCAIALGLMAGLAVWWFEVSVDSEQRQFVPFVMFLVVAGILLGLFQMIPLPGFLGDWMLGLQKELYEKFSGEPPTSARFSLFTEGTRQQIQLLLMAAVSMFLASRFFRKPQEAIVLMSAITANGALLGLFGIVQALTSNKLFWLYEAHSPFASFINRNNAGGYLLMSLACAAGLLVCILPTRTSKTPIPLISREMPYWRQLSEYISFVLSEMTAMKWFVLFGSASVFVSVLATASRGASLALLIATLLTFFIYGFARRPRSLTILIIPFLFLCGAVAVWVGFGEALMERWEGTDLVNIDETDGRVDHWKATAPAISQMGLFGSGLGAYEQVHRLYTQLPERTIFEYAENQFLQTLVEAGVPGLLLLAAAWILAFRYAILLIFRGQSDSTVGIGTMGIFLIVSQIVASQFDFGLYIPANMILMSVLVGMMGYQAHAFTARIKSKTWLNYQFSVSFVRVLILFSFAGLSISALYLYRYSKVDVLVRRNLKAVENKAAGDWRYDQFSMKVLDQKIEELNKQVEKCASIDGVNHLGDLWIHRFRLMTFQSLQESEDYKNAIAIAANEEEKNRLLDDAWMSSNMLSVRSFIQSLGRNSFNRKAMTETKRPNIVENVPHAHHWFAYSRMKAPLQPLVHLKLGQLEGLVEFTSKSIRGASQIEKGIELAPANPDYRLIGGIFFVQSDEFEKAAPQFRKYLELEPGRLAAVMSILTGRTPLNSNPVLPKDTLESVLPQNARMLFDFAKVWCKGALSTRNQALEQTEALIASVDDGEQEKLKLKSEIYLERLDYENAITTMFQILRANPLDEPVRYRIANLLLQEGRLDEALVEAQKLFRSNSTNKSYNQLLKTVEQKIRDK